MERKNKRIVMACCTWCSPFVTTRALLLCLSLMNQAAFAHFAETFRGANWSEFSHTTDSTLIGGQYACDDNDIDNDNDGLIEVCYLEDLDAIRHMPDGSGYKSSASATTSTIGCGNGGCRGYELVRDLDFNDDDSYRSGSTNKEWTIGSGWLPIGRDSFYFHAIFEGNGYTVSHLRINHSADNHNGLFNFQSGHINNIGLLSVNMNGNEWVGSLVGNNIGHISNSYSSGQVAGSTNTGGLVGENSGFIFNSYSTVQVNGGSLSERVGGLVGTNSISITDSYSTGQVTGTQSVGGLVGYNIGSISNSYSIGRVVGDSAVGGLVGERDTTPLRPPPVNNSYWDSAVSNLTTSAGGANRTTTELQSPTNAEGIYKDWSETDWDFGTDYQYPALKYTAERDIIDIEYDTCGNSQQPACGNLLNGAEWKIIRATIPVRGTQFLVNAMEDEVVVLNANQGHLNYHWTLQTSGTSLILPTTNHSELRFLVPNDLVGRKAMTGTLMLQLTVSTGTTTVRQQTVIITVTKTNSGRVGVLDSITQAGAVLVAPSVIPDSDGVGIISSISYQWQRCLLSNGCAEQSMENWSNTVRKGQFYYVAQEEAQQDYRFRVIINYKDGQEYDEQVISKSVAYTVRPAVPFSGSDWSQFPGGAKAVCDDSDIDNDNDGLIELCYLENVDAIRYVLDGSAFQFDSNVQTSSTSGCGSSGCNGYELVRDLDFEADDSYLGITTRLRLEVEGDISWQPIGENSPFSGIFEGNGQTISNLTISRRSGDFVGLFARLTGIINGVGLLDVDVRGRNSVGGLVGNNGGTISNSHSIGQLSGGSNVGGLVGANAGTISNSYSTGQVTGSSNIGGLVGNNSRTISNSYSTGQVDGSGGSNVGGLVGANSGSGMLSNSYSVGQVTGGSNVGGLVGSSNINRTTASYWDITTSNLTVSAGGTSQTTVELQLPTAAAGIYSTWSDANWDFGTTYQYPAIKHGVGTHGDYRACGRSQQLPCTVLLAGAEQEIDRFVIATQTLVRVDAVEGALVVLNGSQGNVNYSWTHVGDARSSLKLNRANTAEMWFVVPEALVGFDNTKTTLEFRLTVSASGETTQQTVRIAVTKVNNGLMTQPTITEVDKRLIMVEADLTSDPDGRATTASYQWQKYLASTSSWVAVLGKGTDESYQIPREEAVGGNRFRAQLTYTDGQGYSATLTSTEYTYPKPRAAFVRLKLFLEGALQ